MSKEAVCSPRADGLVARGAKCERYHSMRLTKEKSRTRKAKGAALRTAHDPPGMGNGG